MADYAELVYGNLAYDRFGTAAPVIEAPFFPQEEVQQPQAEPQAEAQPREKVSVRTAAEARPQARVNVSLFALLGIPAVILCMVLLLKSYIQLTALSQESAALETRIAQLQEEQTRLEIAYESTFDMAQVEQQAKAELGMVKAGTEQVSYIRSSSGDVAVILQQDSGAGHVEKARSFLEKMLAYLR